MLLDLRLPKLDGLSVLASIRESEQLRHLPVIILTSSQHDEDQLAATTLRVQSFLREPFDTTSFLHAVVATTSCALLVVALERQEPEPAG